MFIKITLIF